jgi:hypothetical protein
MDTHHKSIAGHEVADAFIQSADDRVGLLAAGLFLNARSGAMPSPQDVTRFRYQAEQMLRFDAPTAAKAETPVAPQSFWTGGDASMGKLRLKAALSLLGLVIVMAILFRLAGSWLFGPAR